MYAPITSEITLETGTVLREISTGQLFTVVERLKHGGEISGEEEWRLMPLGPTSPQRSSMVLTRQELSQKYFADDEG